MAVLQLDILGSPNIGTYCYSNDKICLAPFGLTKKKINQISNCLDVTVYPFGAAGSILNGVLIAANSNGIVLPHTITDEEAREARAPGLPVMVLNSRYTALGNLILANDKGAIVDPRFSQQEINQLQDILNVEVVKGEIAGLPYVGSLAITTNKGTLTHPNIKDHERTLLEETLKVTSESGTINGGVPFPKLGVIANSRGLITGPLTTGYELAAVTRALQL